MTCAVGRVWEEEVGGRPRGVEEGEVVVVKGGRKRRGSGVEAAAPKRRKCRSPFRPWTPEPPLPAKRSEAGSPPVPASSSTASSSSPKPGRNYKNMSRERRMEANARERTRVHTISAAFETLRRAVPSYSHNQKLSKLSVLKVAASYILTLSRVVGEDYSHDQSAPTLEECVDNVTNTIQMEGKLRKKKDD